MKERAKIRFVLAYLTTVILILILIVSSAFAADSSVDVNNDDDFYNALSNAQSGSVTTINITGSFSAVHTSNYRVPAGAKVVITSSQPRTITYARPTGRGYTFLGFASTNSGAELTLKGKVTIQLDASSGRWNRGVKVTEGNTFNLSGNAVISGFGIDDISVNQYASGGNVFNEGVFNMYGGTITDGKASLFNKAVDLDSITELGALGGNVYNKGTFNMKGGVISNGVTGYRDPAPTLTLQNGTGKTLTLVSYGGNVFNGTDAKFFMSGGTVTGGECRNISYIKSGTGSISRKTGGGGIGIMGANLDLSDGTVSQNLSESGGGGVYVATDTVKSKLIMSNNSIISGNNAAYGGGIAVNTSACIVRIAGGEISGNVSSGYAGGLYIYAPAMLTRVKITGNTASGTSTLGGISEKLSSAGICFDNQNADYVLGEGVLISGNTAVYSGGGVGVRKVKSLTVDGAVIQGNTANKGGGIAVKSGKLILEDGEIRSNTAEEYGGGAALTGGTFEMKGGKISGNTANEAGAAILLSKGTLSLKGGEISANSAPSGMGIFVPTGTEDAYIDMDLDTPGIDGIVSGTVFFGNHGTSETTSTAVLDFRSTGTGDAEGVNTFKDCSFIGNTGRVGTVLYSSLPAHAHEFVFEDCLFSGNETSRFASCLNVNGSTVTVRGSRTEVSGNTSGTSGGFAYIQNGGSLTIEDGLFMNNTSGSSGGVAALDSTNDSLTVTGGVFKSSNSAQSGQIFRVPSNGAITISGAPKFERSLFLAQGAKIIKGGEFSWEGFLPVSVYGMAQSGDEIVISGSGTGMTLKPSDAVKFKLISNAEGVNLLPIYDTLANKVKVKAVTGVAAYDGSAVYNICNNTGYATLAAAYSSASADDVLVLQQDIVLPVPAATEDTYFKIEKGITLSRIPGATSMPSVSGAQTERALRLILFYSPSGVVSNYYIYGIKLDGSSCSRTVGNWSSRDRITFNSSEIIGSSNNHVITNWGTVNIQGGTVIRGAEGYAGIRNASSSYSVINMSGGVIRNCGRGILDDTGGTVNISGGEIRNNYIGENNQGTARGGGGIYTAGTLNITGGKIHDNKASAYGGAVYAVSGTVNITGVEIYNNVAETKWGGAVYASSGTTVNIADSVIRNNVSYGGGGGILSNGTLNIEDTVFSGNVNGAYYNGNTLTARTDADTSGSAVYGDNTSAVSLKNVTITGNAGGYPLFMSGGNSAANSVIFDGDIIIKDNAADITNPQNGAFAPAAGTKPLGFFWNRDKDQRTSVKFRNTLSKGTDALISLSIALNSVDERIVMGKTVNAAGTPTSEDISGVLKGFKTYEGVFLIQNGQDAEFGFGRGFMRSSGKQANIGFFGDGVMYPDTGIFFGAMAFEDGIFIPTIGGGLSSNNINTNNTYNLFTGSIFSWSNNNASGEVTEVKSKTLNRIFDKKEPNVDYFIATTGRDYSVNTTRYETYYEARSVKAYKKLNELMLAQNPNGKLVLIAPPGFQDGCSFFSENSDIKGTDWSRKAHNDLINAQASKLAHEIPGSIVVRAGDAFEYFFDHYPNSGIDLYREDLRHPNDAGAYYIAAVLYETLFGKTVYKMDFKGYLTDNEAETLQKAAHEFVFGYTPTTADAHQTVTPIQFYFDDVDPRFASQTFPQNFEYLLTNAKAYYDRHIFVQYDQRSQDREARIFYRRTVKKNEQYPSNQAYNSVIDCAPETGTPQNMLYLDCTSFVYTLFKNTFDFELPENASYGMTYRNMDVSGKLGVKYEYNTHTGALWLNGSSAGTKTLQEGINIFLSTLQPGDIIAFNNTRDKPEDTPEVGHGTIYLGNGFIMHCSTTSRISGGSADYQFDRKIDAHESMGGIRFDKVDCFTRETKVFYELYPEYYTTLRIIRPTYANLSPTQDAQNRVSGMKGIVAYKTSSAPAGVNVKRGDTVTITVNVKNLSTAQKTVQVTDTLPSGLTLCSGYSNNFSLTVQPGKTASREYKVKVSTTAENGTYIDYRGTKVNGVNLGNTSVYVGNTLTSPNTVKTAAYASSATTGYGIVQSVYNTLGVALPFSSAQDAFDKAFVTDQNPNLAHCVMLNKTSTGRSDAFAKGLYGGRYAVIRNDTYCTSFGLFNGRRLKYIDYYNLVPGDVICVAEGDNRNAPKALYLYLGDGEFITAKDGVRKIINSTADARELLERMLGEYAFVVYRPVLCD